MPKRPEAWPRLAHRFGIHRIERAEGFGVEVDFAAVAAFGFFEFLIAKEDGAGDDAGLELIQHDRARLGVQAGGSISIPPFVGGQIVQKDLRLHLVDAFNPTNPFWNDRSSAKFRTAGMSRRMSRPPSCSLQLAAER